MISGQLVHMCVLCGAHVCVLWCICVCCRVWKPRFFSPSSRWKLDHERMKHFRNTFIQVIGMITLRMRHGVLVLVEHVVFEQIELPAKLLDYFVWREKSNINQYDSCLWKCDPSDVQQLWNGKLWFSLYLVVHVPMGNLVRIEFVLGILSVLVKLHLKHDHDLPIIGIVETYSYVP